MQLFILNASKFRSQGVSIGFKTVMRLYQIRKYGVGDTENQQHIPMHCHFNFKNGSKGTGAKRYESPGTPGSTGAFSPAAPYKSAPMAMCVNNNLFDFI